MSVSAGEFLKQTEFDKGDSQKLAGDASSRSYERIMADGKSAILMLDPDHASIEAFLKVTDILEDWGYSAPKILKDGSKDGLLLLEDFGNELLARILEKSPKREQELYTLAVDFLVDLTKQDAPTGLAYYSQSYALDQNAVFLDWYVPEILGEPLPENARFFFQQIWQELFELISEDKEVFLYRDFHAENLFFLKDRKGLRQLGLIDYQDAMTGPAAYDMASLLQDARRSVSPELATAMIDHYVSKTNVDEKEFMRSYSILGAHRCLRILGIFTRLAKQQDKDRYSRFMPRVLGYLNSNLAHPDLVALKHWIKVTLGNSMEEVNL
jgi:aminoglycoside/choline kinase family phosphotransferase